MFFDFFDTKYISRRNSLKWWGWRALAGIMILWILYLFVLPLSIWLNPINSDTIGTIYGRFWGRTLTDNLFFPLVSGWQWFTDYVFREPKHYTWDSFFAWKLPLVPTFLFFMYELWLFVLNPYTFADQTFGSGHEARDDEVKRMGLFDGKYLFLGNYGPRNKKLKLPDTRSVFCIGMPGSGKTTGVVVPAILEMDNASLIINDPKGELARLTSGYRATKGPVFMMNWAGVDEPEKGIRWPCWNPIGGGNLPPLHAGREGYIDTLISFLIPDGPTGADPYWTKAGRGCLTGLTGYLCGKVEQARANDYFVSRLTEGQLDDEDYVVLLSYYKSMRDFPEVIAAIKNAENKSITKDNYLPIGKWDPIPQSWQGAEDACFAMLLDIITNSQIRINEELAERRRMGDPSVMMTDAWKILLDEVVLETAYYGYGRRTLLELNQIAGLPDKQRGSVISMALSGVNLFKNAAVRTRTSMNDFNYDQLRGMKNSETGEYEPITVYMSVPYEDLNSSILLSTLFINMATG
ncbi:MAG: type IV secretory system conjugative DNA transfer family protein [Alphaproteobacteria bacterium]|nr:type IV secretory system conjugative DNA transfer family protein [Alphaproteobacteria bacterium]